MTTLQNIIEEFGFFRDLSLDAIMSHLKVCNAFAHGKDQVRDMARNITVACYHSFGDEVRNHLKSLRPKQMEEYENAFSGGQGMVKKKLKQQPKQELKRKDGNSKKGAKKTSPRGGGGGSGSGSGSGGGNEPSRPQGDIEISTSQNQGGQRLTISNAAGDGRDININLTVQASPNKRNTGAAVDMEAEMNGEEDNPFTCQFCGRYDPNFTEDMLDMHYWKECPCLMSCTFCGQGK
jgi:centrosomal protein CEP104